MVNSRMDPKIKALSTVGLFSGCSKKELQSVARLCTPLSLEEGFVLTTEGTPGRECFVITDGKARVTIGGRKVGEVGPGECVGEMALLEARPRRPAAGARPAGDNALPVSGAAHAAAWDRACPSRIV
jgi:cyclic nucleotide-binding protein